MTTKSKLGNTALPMAEKKAITSDTVKEAAANIPSLVVKTGIFVVGGLIFYRFVTTRFSTWKEVSSYPAANISMAQAKSKAESIYQSTGYFGYGNDFENIKQQIEGVNYNGFVRIYNAFNQKGNIVTGYSDLISFLQSKLTNDQIQQLRFLLSGAFLKTAVVSQPKELVKQSVAQESTFLGV